MIASYLATVFLLATVRFAHCGKPGKPRWEPLPVCQDCVSPELIIAPGVGFDLTPSYGTAAIRLYDGSSITVGKVEGDDSYKSLMKQLSLESSRPPRGKPQFDTIWDELQYLLKRAKRQLNKRRGLPATEDVGIIANMIKELRIACESSLGHSITAAVAARPNLPGITVEDLDDAMQYAGLHSLRSYNYFGDVSETSAAFAGMGYGLCSTPRELDTCEDEEAEMALQYVLAVGFTQSSLTVTYTPLRDAHTSREHTSVLDYDLGLGSLNHFPDASTYWNRVRSTISGVAATAPEPLTTLLLLGEEGADAKFLDVVRDALGGLQGLTTSRFRSLSVQTDPLYMAATGAAEFAKRFQEMPWGCKEPARCRENQVLVDQTNEMLVNQAPLEL